MKMTREREVELRRIAKVLARNGPDVRFASADHKRAVIRKWIKEKFLGDLTADELNFLIEEACDKAVMAAHGYKEGRGGEWHRTGRR